MKVAIIFDRFGPYHIARLKAASKYLDVYAIEISGETSDYQWDKVQNTDMENRITLFEHHESKQLSRSELTSKLVDALDSINPEAVAINGWFDRAAIIALSWCLQNGKPSIVMSESAATDGKRNVIKEYLKRKIVNRFSSGLVGGIRHAEYLNELGIEKNNIFFGYDVIDNQYFSQEVEKVKAMKDYWIQNKNLPVNYFLVVSRFIEKKNLPFVIEAYNEYYKSNKVNAWHLMILGDGHLKNQLLEKTKNLELENMIHFEGFKQYNELPIYFGLANAFIHASTTEQWGLVINEAMASGLPVIVSQNCGCVPELVHDGVNGYVIDPKNKGELVKKMAILSNGSKDFIKTMGYESRRIIAGFDSDAFGQGLKNAVVAATKKRKKKAGFDTKLILNLFSRS